MLQQLQTQLDTAQTQEAEAQAAAQQAKAQVDTMAASHSAQLVTLQGALDLKLQDMQASMLQVRHTFTCVSHQVDLLPAPSCAF
jgi:hypothetical protein